MCTEAANKENLEFDAVGKGDVGTYSCNASNVAGYVYKVVYVSILTQEPYFVEGPRTKQVREIHIVRTTSHQDQYEQGTAFGVL